MSNFFRIPTGDLWYLIGLIAFSAIAFLPFWRDMTLAGMSVFGWLMAVLMVLSPGIALVRFVQTERSRRASEKKR
jgi:hypothetical protein